MKYPKINSLFKRDERGGIKLGEYSKPEFEVLASTRWEATEKVDGTNIRVYIDFNSNDYHASVFRGKTDDAQIPPHLLTRLRGIFYFHPERIRKAFRTPRPQSIVLYGEGYGHKIGRNGDKYLSDTVDFILFDIQINGIWLSRKPCEEIAKVLGIDIVPLVGYYTIDEAIARVKEGFHSTIPHALECDAEGLVLKAPLGLKDKDGDRIITKVKAADFY